METILVCDDCFIRYIGEVTHKPFIDGVKKCDVCEEKTANHVQSKKEYITARQFSMMKELTELLKELRR